MSESEKLQPDDRIRQKSLLYLRAAVGLAWGSILIVVFGTMFLEDPGEGQNAPPPPLPLPFQVAMVLCVLAHWAANGLVIKGLEAYRCIDKNASLGSTRNNGVDLRALYDAAVGLAYVPMIPLFSAPIALSAVTENKDVQMVDEF